MGKQFQLLVFDWDGTLMDSEIQIVSCITKASIDLAVQPPTSDVIKKIIGLGLHEALSTLYPGSDNDFHLKMAERFRHHFYNDDAIEARLFEGAGDLIKQLHKQGYLLAVATGKGRFGLDMALSSVDCGHCFHASRCADETQSKPHPQMLVEIMQELSVTPERTLMIGDTEFDLIMSKNAGIASLAVSYGVHDKEQLLQHDPLACVSSIMELKQWFGV